MRHGGGAALRTARRPGVGRIVRRALFGIAPVLTVVLAGSDESVADAELRKQVLRLCGVLLELLP